LDGDEVFYVDLTSSSSDSIYDALSGVSVEVTNLEMFGNAPPIAEIDQSTVDENDAVVIDVLNNDSDPDEDTLSVDSYTEPASGDLSLDGDSFTYTPDVEFVGEDFFSYTISDGNGGFDTA
jgi:hypothetical protein